MLIQKPLIERLIVLLDMEVKALKADNQTDFSTFLEEKSRILLEVSSLKAGSLTDDDRDLFKRLNGALTRNSAALKYMMNATQAISDMLAADLRAAQSDGTYCRSAYGAGGRL